MAQSYSMGKLLGVRVKLHYSMFIVFLLFTWIIAVQHLTVLGLPVGVGSLAVPLAARLALGLAVAVLFFMSVLLHELAHSYVAQRMGIKVEGITLFIFGGVSEMEDVPREPWSELKMALSGPMTSLALGLALLAAFLGLRLAAGGFALEAATLVTGTMAFYNLALAAFNLLPAFPMDGGRVLRALLAMRMGTARATVSAVDVGRTMAIIMGVFGLFTFNIWLILIAVFIFMGATSEGASTKVMLALEHHSISEMMERTAASVPPTMTLGELWGHMWQHRQLAFPVVDGGKLVGLVTFDKLTGLDQQRLASMRVMDVMSAQVQTAAPGDDAMEAFKVLIRSKADRLVVVEGGLVTGVVTRADFMRAAQLAGA